VTSIVLGGLLDIGKDVECQVRGSNQRQTMDHGYVNFCWRMPNINLQKVKDEEKVEGPRWMECGSIIFLKNFDFFYFNLIFFGCF
jgi:hypothetical protein